MATTVTTDFLHSFDGKIGKVQQIAGAWQTISTKTDFNNFTTNATTKQNLATGMFFYVSDEDQLYKAKVTGVGPFATWSLDSASFSGIDTSSFLTADDTGSFLIAADTASFVLNSQTGSFLLVSQTGSFLTAADTSSFVFVSQTSSMSVASASYVSPTFISASAAAAGFGAGGELPSGVISSSAQLPSGVISSSVQLPSGIVSSSTQTLLYLNGTDILSGSILTSSISNFDTEVSRSAALAGFGAGGGSIDTSSLVRIDQTSSMSVATASYALYAVSASYEIVTELSSSHAVNADTASFISDTFISASAARSGFGVGGGSTDVSALNTFTGSIQTQVDSLTAETSSYLTSADTASFILVSQTSSMSVLSALTASFISDTFISASAARSGFGGGLSIDTSSFITNDQTSSFLLISETGSFLTAADTSSFLLISETGSFLTAADTSSFLTAADTSSFLTAADTSSLVLVSQTSSMSVATASYIDPTFISSSAAAAGFGSGGGGSTPAGTVSGSQQIADLGYINQTQTSSMSVLSASYAITASYAAVLEIGSEISGPGFSINQDGILTLSATTETGSLGAGSIWYDGNDFYFNV